MKFTNFMITIIISSLFIVGFGLIISDLHYKYDLSDSGYNESNIEVFNQIENTHDLSQNMQERIANYETDRSIYDIIGGFIADARDTLLIGASSFDFLTTMVNNGFSAIGIDPIFRSAFITIMILIIFVGIILATIIGRDL